MFVIFGTKIRGSVLAMLSYVCGNCAQPAAHRISTYWRWFTLFFVPVFPIGKKRHLDTCIACGVTYELTREQAEAIIGGPGQPEFTDTRVA